MLEIPGIFFFGVGVNSRSWVRAYVRRKMRAPSTPWAFIEFSRAYYWVVAYGNYANVTNHQTVRMRMWICFCLFVWLEPDETLHYAALHLGIQCLSKWAHTRVAYYAMGICLTFKFVNMKQFGPRWNAALCSISSGPSEFRLYFAPGCAEVETWYTEARWRVHKHRNFQTDHWPVQTIKI